MPKVGRNDPCPCGSGKKYKHCHLPLEAAAQAEQLRLRRAVDMLLSKVIAAAQEQAAALPAALDRFWQGKYTLDQLDALDELEGRGAERFLTWFAFDYPLDDGRTLVERMASGAEEPELSDDEVRLLTGWMATRLRPYVAEQVSRGQGMRVRDLLDAAAYEVEDHAASRRVDPGEVLVGHLVPAGRYSYVAGAAAHLTEDTSAKLREFAELHLEAYRRDHPDATWADMLRKHGEVLNHFVMQLPTEAPNPSLLEQIIMQTRISLKLAGESLGLKKEEG